MPNGKKSVETRKRLTNQQRAVIVTELACFTPAMVISQMIVDDGGPKLTTSMIAYYNPDASWSQLQDKWKTLFYATRKKFIEDTSLVAIAHKSFRLRRADRLARRLEEKLDGEIAKINPNVFNSIVERIQSIDEQAAKDVGDAFTNRRTLTIGDPEEELAKTLGITVEELRLAIAGVGGEAASGA